LTAFDNEKAPGDYTLRRAVLEKLGGKHDWRSASDALWFANPLAQNIYQIQPGDTLGDISDRTGVSQQQLMALNGDMNRDGHVDAKDWGRINAGQRIFTIPPQFGRRGQIR